MPTIERDSYYRKIAETVATKSRCLSRRIGAVLVKYDTIISTGYNGPPRGVPHCAERMSQRPYGDDGILPHYPFAEPSAVVDLRICPRYQCGHKSGEGLHMCPAAHAEANTIANAARSGISTVDSTLYLTCEIPCSECWKLILGAGITRVVTTSSRPYDKMAQWLVRHSPGVELSTYPPPPADPKTETPGRKE